MTMRSLVPGLALCLAACVPPDPETSKSAFPSAMADAVCRWIFACCDPAERKEHAGGTADQTGCTNQLTASYTTLFKDADETRWNGVEAQALVDAVVDAARVENCPKAFDPDTELRKRTIVEPTKQAGNACTNHWDCSTKFCRNQVCATPWPVGSACAADQPCESQARCISGVCKALQPVGAACTTSLECMTASCDGTKCVSGAYHCDGK